MASKSSVPVFVAGMLLTGISNSLLNKWQDMQCVENCDSPDPKQRVEFSQPVWQTLQMFLGECLCLLPVLVRILFQRLQSSRDAAVKKPLLPRSPLLDSGIAVNNSSFYNDPPAEEYDQPETSIVTQEMSSRAIGLFFLPAFCDLCGTTLMNVGLLFVPVSIYQMTRGALVLWVGVFSVIFLRRHLYLYQWFSLVTVMLGVSVVGMSGTLLQSSASPKTFDSDPLTGHLPDSAQAFLGVLLILFAQLFSAAQFVIEELIMSRYSIEPLLAVGYEGMFGALSTLIAMPILHYFIGSTPSGKGGYFDVWAGWSQIISNSVVLWTSVAIALSIAFFNFFGLSVTRNVSATARSTIDTCRTVGIWVVSLVLGWEIFRPLSGGLQVLGFALLVYGTFLFNDIVPPPVCFSSAVAHQYRPVSSDQESD